MCRRWYQAITYTHLLYRHGITDPQTYKEEYSLIHITSPKVRGKIAERKFALNRSEINFIRVNWGKRPVAEISSHLQKDNATVRAYAVRLGLGLLVEKWTKAKVLKNIRQARRQRLILNSGEARNSMGRLYRAAVRHFGSWKNALEEAGIRYDTVARRGPFESWSVERVVREILDLKTKGVERNYSYLQAHHAKLYAAARNCFGSWAEALRIAGAQPGQRPHSTPLTPSREVGPNI
jgi:hypothetical protein